MPEISRFFGIIIRMYAEPEAQHNMAHFHVRYQEIDAVFSIDPVELIAGELPARQRRFVEAWAEMHQGELQNDWHILQNGRNPLSIEPLR